MDDDVMPPRTRPQSSVYDSYLQESLNVLICSEYLLYQLIDAHGYWPQDATPPPEPANYATTGSLDCGVFLFMICNSGYITNSDLQDAADLYYYAVWAAVGSKPQTYLTPDIYSSLDAWNLVGPDGSVAATGAFEMYDQNWLYALMNLGECVYNEAVYNNGVLKLPDASYEPVKLDGGAGTTCTVGLISDWGTGDNAAAGVMSALNDLAPDSIIHLGDVYYSGTPTTSSDFYVLGEEQENLIVPWPSDYTNPCFTMNSNHEMYTGAQGLFTVALDGTSTIFSSQQGYSVFVATVADWTILGLDSAFNGAPESLYMSGVLDAPGNGSAASSQVNWIKSLGLDPAKTIVLTHHNGFDPNCSAAVDSTYLTFRQQLHDALGALPYAWFWGHVHNAVVYDKLVLNGVLVNALCRCIGNSALPYGVATGLNSPSIVWQAAETGSPTSNRLSNGYATLAFAIGDGDTVDTITESYYTTASTTAAYSTTLFSASLGGS